MDLFNQFGELGVAYELCETRKVTAEGLKLLGLYYQDSELFCLHGLTNALAKQYICINCSYIPELGGVWGVFIDTSGGQSV
jgi:hypothetical protein